MKDLETQIDEMMQVYDAEFLMGLESLALQGTEIEAESIDFDEAA